MSHTPPVEPKAPVDSKGAAIDEQILKIVNDNRCDDHRCSRVADLNENATQAILALLAQEVKRVIGEDEPEYMHQGKAVYFVQKGHRGVKIPDNVIRNQLRREARRKAGLV